MARICIVDDYSDGSISFWYSELEDADRDQIDEILTKYSTSGYSCRGPIVAVLEDLKDFFKSILHR